MAGALARLLLPAALLLLPARLPPPAAQAPSQLRVLFTPTVCRVHCAGHRCTHRCERGNATVLYSGEPAGPAARATGFRVFLCPLLCQNGGVCIRKDQCLCPPSFTGKFCQIQSPRPQAPAPGQEVDSPGGAQPLTKSVYTLPLTNHQQERDGKGPWGGALSMVNVHVQHPPEASVIIHQVERVSEPSTPGEPPANALPPARPALYSVLAQSSPRTPPQLAALTQPLSLQCSAPLPGLRTQDICCRGAGVAWGKRLCGASPWPPVSLKHQSSQLPGPTLTPFRFSPDVDECQEGGFCQNGLCTNTPGSFSCLCHTGYILDSSRSSCISHHVISEAKGPCYRVLRDSTCSLPTLRNITKQICCCSRVGKAWGWGCERCPHFGSGEPRQMPGFSPGSRGGEPGRLGSPRAAGARGGAPPQHPPSMSPHLCPSSTLLPPSCPVCALPIASQTHPWQTQQRGWMEPSSVCERNPEICGPGRCGPRQGSYTCLCHPGFWLSTQGTHCIDMDECRQRPRPCANGRCENTVGSFRCVCAPGYRAAPALEGVGAPCPARSCGSLTPCPWFARADIDECENHLACPGQECVNSPGSFQCLPCRDGHRLRNGRCTGTGPPAGPGGPLPFLRALHRYRPPRGPWAPHADPPVDPSPSCGRCTGTARPWRCPPRGLCSPSALPPPLLLCPSLADIDECLTGSPCGPHGRCSNTEGSFRCECSQGYRAGAPGGPCAGKCGTRGGLTGPGRTPTLLTPSFADVNECLEGEFCFPHGECLNTDGSYTCLCAPGFIARDGRHCQDVNECETLQGVCGAELCENVEGSFLCICPSSAQEFDPMTGRCTRLPTHVRDPSRQECYYQACEKVLARNATRQECCCSLGHAWGPACPAQPCPDPGTVEYQALCPRGNGYAAAGPLGALTGECYMDECALFSTQLCRGGVCVNKAPGYACYCPNGYYYETHHLECIDNDECRDEEAEPCVEGGCVNTIGSFYCACSPPLVLDGSQRRCVANDSQALDENQAVCWQEVGPDLVCSRPRLDRQVTYTECCCLYGEAWGMDCALCPARDSGEGPNPQTLPAAGGPAVKWGPGLRPDYDPYRFEGLRAEECGVLNGCENGQCVRVPHGFTCRCDPGFRLDTAHMACLDIDECAEAEGPPALCLNGRCLNTDGSYRCLCPRGYVLSQPPPSCIPARPRA
uniref:Latent-transforming growth factor beta-binding protein 4 n=1 Tax=Gopherus evgoodei TaxID=1825980 RepID=A0A8C4YJN6_9SAUR